VVTAAAAADRGDTVGVLAQWVRQIGDKLGGNFGAVNLQVMCQYCDHVSLLVCWLVGWLVCPWLALIVISRHVYKSDFREVSHRCSALLTLPRSRSKFKVKTAVLKIIGRIIARP